MQKTRSARFIQEGIKRCAYACVCVCAFLSVALQFSFTCVRFDDDDDDDQRRPWLLTTRAHIFLLFHRVCVCILRQILTPFSVRFSLVVWAFQVHGSIANAARWMVLDGTRHKNHFFSTKATEQNMLIFDLYSYARRLCESERVDVIRWVATWTIRTAGSNISNNHRKIHTARSVAFRIHSTCVGIYAKKDHTTRTHRNPIEWDSNR